VSADKKRLVGLVDNLIRPNPGSFDGWLEEFADAENCAQTLIDVIRAAEARLVVAIATANDEAV